ncbi:type 1 glutamine amidotransferase domain-containing protein [Devosia sp.]|uniref:type 1 glutamine amidotransferase domain-containing protein n=1 Tax=Devosia sp. TaxID=1871048 RepID=UPI002EEBCFC8
MHDLKGKTIAILATDGYEQAELEVPLARFEEAGAKVDIVSPKAGVIKSWHHGDWGRTVDVDRPLSAVSAGDYDALVLPGGVINPDHLRVEPAAIELIRAFWTGNKVVAAICHAPWLLVEAGIVRGRNVTSYHSIRTDVINAGGVWHDSDVVVDQGLVTSRKPSDLESFCLKVAEEIAEGRHQRRAA